MSKNLMFVIEKSLMLCSRQISLQYMLLNDDLKNYYAMSKFN